MERKICSRIPNKKYKDFSNKQERNTESSIGLLDGRFNTREGTTEPEVALHITKIIVVKTKFETMAFSLI